MELQQIINKTIRYGYGRSDKLVDFLKWLQGKNARYDLKLWELFVLEDAMKGLINDDGHHLEMGRQIGFPKGDFGDTRIFKLYREFNNGKTIHSN